MTGMVIGDHASLLQASSSKILNTCAHALATRVTVKVQTVSQRFRSQLNSMMRRIGDSSQHFIRCLKPKPYARKPDAISVDFEAHIMSPLEDRIGRSAKKVELS